MWCHVTERTSLIIILVRVSLSLLDQFAKTIESRGGVGEYWKTVMNEQSMPQAIGGLLGVVPDSTQKKKADDCHENMKKPFVGTEEFEPRPNNSTKATDSLPKSQAYPDKKSFVAKEEKQSSFDEDFEPRPDKDIGPERSGFMTVRYVWFGVYVSS
ncbi:organ-specific protein P4-like [Pyrus ussuriensis x Pyrus communis]|uniref:Organ-specific protein P4-like n=1 Tax=Pyrus ussuriensis x Pyrus communis TaxID=2448454 RepID=A0A5N5FIX9_9ROSA|nr:organ-specific protein P4-like [Pyrus ussuriensis x Pyrus communis]